MLLSSILIPVIVGFVGTVAAAAISWIVERAQMARANREMQIKLSIELCKKIIDAFDNVFAHLNNDIWYIAWRKAMEDKFNYPDDLIKVDENNWKNFQDCLSDFQMHHIEYETELKGYFGAQGYEAFLFIVCANLIEDLSSMVWRVYYNSRIVKSNNSTVPLFLVRGNHDEEVRFYFDEDAQAKSRQEYFAKVTKLRERIATLSSTMIHCIQVMNVGSLATDGPEPVPEEDFEEAEKLLGGTVRRRYQSKKSEYTSAVKQSSENAV